MGAQFGEVLPNSGFDRQTPSGGPGVVIPLKGSNLVILDGGKGLKLSSAAKPLLDFTDIKDEQYHRALIDARYPCSTTDKALDMTLLKSGTWRLVKITANSLMGLGSKVEAYNPKTSKSEATLKVIVLKEKRVKIAIRPVQVRDGGGKLVYSSTNPGDPKVLLDQMNTIWKPQANVVFELSNTDPVPIEQLKPGQPADIANDTLKAAFVAKKDPAAALTFFMVKRALSRGNVDLGVTNAEAGFALISDDRSENTMAHEAGHFLGALSESGKFSQRYGHQGTAPNLLMRDGGAGQKIPYHLVPDFNKGYRA